MGGFLSVGFVISFTDLDSLASKQAGAREKTMKEKKYTSEELNTFISENYLTKTDAEISKILGISDNAVRHRRRKRGLKRDGSFVKPLTTEEVSSVVCVERQEDQYKAVISNLNKKYKEVIRLLGRVEAEKDAILALEENGNTFSITEEKSFSGSTATAFLVASDWHVEEKVGREIGNNKYNLEIARRRGELFFRRGLKLIKKEQQDVKISNLVLPLLGDFITNDIHDEMSENNLLLPIEAIIFAQEMIESGIKFLLQNSKLNITCVCHSGNHARTTKTTRHTTEKGHSLEYFMYHTLKKRLSSRRVKFIIADSYHTMLDVYNMRVRIHHGHNIKGGGGIGGIAVPINRWIAKQNNNERADLDILGHFHQYMIGSNFVLNGSMIGFNAFGQAISAPAEPPKQAFFLIDKRRGLTVSAPILFED